MPTAAKSPAIKTFKFSELLNHPRQAETNILIGDGLLKDNAILALVGPSKSFKSFVLNTIAIDLITKRNIFAVTRSDHGRTIPAFSVAKSCKVLLIEQEIGPDDLEDRFKPLYNSLSPDEKDLARNNFFTHSLDHTLQLDTTEGFANLQRVVSEVKPDVLILDPLIEFHTSNENDTQAMTRIMRRFDQLREQFNPLAIIFSHHEGHTSVQNPRQGINRFRGNSSVGAKIDSALLVTVHNRRNLQLRIDFVLRRGKPLDSLFVQLDGDLRAQFLCWYRDPKKKVKIADLEDENGEVLLQ